MGMLRAIHALHMLFETVSRMTVYGLQNGGNPGMGLIMCLTLSFIYLDETRNKILSAVEWQNRFFEECYCHLFHATQWPVMLH